MHEVIISLIPLIKVVVSRVNNPHAERRIWFAAVGGWGGCCCSAVVAACAVQYRMITKTCHPKIVITVGHPKIVITIVDVKCEEMLFMLYAIYMTS